MSVNDVVTVNISASGPAPSLPGFGTALIAAYHTHGGARRVLGPFVSAADVVASGGFGATDPVVLCANKYFAQSPAPSQVYVGRRANEFTQIVTLTPESSTAGTVYAFTVGAVGGVGGTLISYTVPGSSSISAICTALGSAMAAAATAYGFSATPSSTTVVCTTTAAGTLIEWQMQVPASICRIGETTADPGIAADLTAIWAENKAWYGLLLDSNSKNEVEAAAAWVETNGLVIFAASTSDSDAADSTVTTDVLSFLKSNSVFRTAGLFNQYSNMSYGAAGWMGGRLTATPGSDTWDLKTITNVQADSDLLVPEASITAVNNKNGTVYVTTAGINCTLGGTSGGGEWMDQTRFIDWLHANIQIQTFGYMQGVAKVPYTDAGIFQLVCVLKSVLQQGVDAGGITDNSAVVTPPTAASIAKTFKQSRTLPNLPWTAQLQGAIQRLTINGVLTA